MIAKNAFEGYSPVEKSRHSFIGWLLQTLAHFSHSVVNDNYDFAKHFGGGLFAFWRWHFQTAIYKDPFTLSLSNASWCLLS